MFQALASLDPLLSYLESLEGGERGRPDRRGDDDDDDGTVGGGGVASDLLRTLRYVNGEAADAGRRTARLATTGPSYATMITMTTILRSLWSPFSSSSGGMSGR